MAILLLANYLAIALDHEISRIPEAGPEPCFRPWVLRILQLAIPLMVVGASIAIKAYVIGHGIGLEDGAWAQNIFFIVMHPGYKVFMWQLRLYWTSALAVAFALLRSMLPERPRLLAFTVLCLGISFVWYSFALGAHISDPLGFFDWVVKDMTLVFAAWFVWFFSYHKGISLRKIFCITCPLNWVVGFGALLLVLLLGGDKGEKLIQGQVSGMAVLTLLIGLISNALVQIDALIILVCCSRCVKRHDGSPQYPQAPVTPLEYRTSNPDEVELQMRQSSTGVHSADCTPAQPRN